MQNGIDAKRKKYLITGASSGIGAATCLEIAHEADIILLGRNQERLEQVCHSLPQGNHYVIKADLMQIENIVNIINDVYEKYGVLDGFVHCAGIGGFERISKTSYEYAHDRMKLHYYAFLEFVSCIMRKKKKSHPFSIVAISSLATISFEKYITTYSASKAAIEAAVRTLSTELILKNTVINAIRPAMVDTPMLEGYNSTVTDISQEIKDNGFQPMGLIPVKNVAQLVQFLMSDAARYTTGTMVHINGGASC